MPRTPDVPLVLKNDAITLAGVAALVQSGRVGNIVISPGPGTPHNPGDIGEGGLSGGRGACARSPRRL